MNKTIMIFLQYDGTEKLGKDILSKGKTIWAGHNILQTLGFVENEWDELFFCEFDKKAYKDVLDRLSGENKIKNYKIILVKPYQSEQMDKINKFLKSFVNKEIDTTPGIDLEEAFTEERGEFDFSPESYKKMKQRDKTLPFTMVIFNQFRDKSVYPDDYEGDKYPIGRDAYKLYGRVAVQYQGEYGTEMLLAGLCRATVIGDEQWDDFVCVSYADGESFESRGSSTRIFKSNQSVCSYTSRRVFISFINFQIDI